MDHLYLHLSSAQTDIFIPTLILLGFCVGMISGFLGIGGAWMMTPALNVLGFPMTYAIGTDIAHVAGKSIFATIRHSRFGHIDYKLAVVMVAGTVVGVEIGAQFVLFLESQNLDAVVIRWIYLAILSVIATFFLSTLFKRTKELTWQRKLHKIPLYPVITFSKAGITCSLWLPLFIALVTGVFSGLLGIGGGLLRVPLLIYFLGCPTIVAVGTDLFEVMISGVYGTFSYATKGRIDFSATFVMLSGALVGTELGAYASKYASEKKIQLAFTLAVVASFFSILCKQLGHATVSELLIFSIIGVLTLYIIFHFLVAKRSKLSGEHEPFRSP